MGTISTILGTFGFGFGTTVGIVIGYYLFIYHQSTDDPEIKPLVELDSETIATMFPEIPLWVKNPDFDRIDWLNKLIGHIAMKKPVGLLNVKVIKAIKLKKKDLLGGSDPYVKLTLSGDKVPGKKTVVKHSNLNPEWNEEFDLVVKEPESQELQLIVYDWEQVGKHDKIGMNVIQLKDLTLEEPKLMTLELLKSMEPNEPVSEKSRGQLVVEVEYKPFKEDEIPENLDDPNAVEKAPEGTPSGGGLLVVIVHEAEDLEGKYHTNPSVRLMFKGEERKTKRVKKNREPRWDEDFQFPLDEPPINDKLHVEVISTTSRIGLNMHPKETLGYVVINLGDVVSNRRINDKYHLIDSKNGRIQIELQWRTSS
ncbi:hypothetical protein F2Q70_00031105 [Brassica cretica]|uniref:C2 domain-containing protein n=1 Tax=Brassica cretica TaxID=69181 RepID=A0A8S9FNR6_BRACR|nr:hypothetical protein F2Q70_00031105 [Brassica cretica]